MYPGYYIIPWQLHPCNLYEIQEISSYVLDLFQICLREIAALPVD